MSEKIQLIYAVTTQVTPALCGPYYQDYFSTYTGSIDPAKLEINQILRMALFREAGLQIVHYISTFRRHPNE